MCIIAWYKRGQKPTRERLETMMSANAHGVGVAWNNGKAVFFQKGFSTVDGVEKYIAEVQKLGARDVVFHARIATSGGISAEKCHPYPVARKDDELNKTRHASRDALRPVVFHNGVFPITTDAGLNDTQTFIRHSLAPIVDGDARAVKRGDFDDILTMATRGSRLLLLYPDAVRTYGEWERDDGGVLYSNTSYKPRPVYYWEEWDGHAWNDYYAGRYPYSRTRAKGGTK